MAAKLALPEGAVEAGENDACALVLPAKMLIKEGSDIGGGVRLGTVLGAGVQARVFELVDKDGKPTDKVIKVNHADLGHKLLNNNYVWIGLEREWQIGQQLRAVMQEPDGEVPGFMKVLDVLARTPNKDAPHAHFNGMVMERLNGWEVWKRIDTPEFCNIHYVREMLFQVFSALDRAQRKLGFHHADLGMRNIMEHYPKLWKDVEEADGEAPAEVEAEPEGEGEGAKDDASELSSDSFQLSTSTFLTSRSLARGLMPKPRPGFSCNADGTRMPLGPHIEFKIIDFGVAAFNPLLAQSAGGYEYEEAMEKMENVMSKMDLSKLGGPKRTKLVSGANLPKFIPGARMELEMVPTQQDNRFLLVKPKPKGQEAASAGDASNLASQSSQAKKTPMSAIEVMYRKFWKRKGDVYHILLSLAIVLDDRVWPKQDEKDVMNFVSLVHHVTGVKLKARFARGSRKSMKKLLGKLYCMTTRRRVKTQAKGEGEDLGLGSSLFRKSRRMHIRLKAHLYPYNSGLLAGEALVSPFFGVGRAPHADLPVNVEAAFPRDAV